jgi:hypothetical protein
VQPPTESADVPARIPSLSDVLHDAQEKINMMGDMINARQELNVPTPAEQAADVASEQQVEDDLTARRQRLSKPKSQ